MSSYLHPCEASAGCARLKQQSGPQCALGAPRLWGRGRGRGRRLWGGSRGDTGFLGGGSYIPARETCERGTFIRCTSVRCTPMRRTYEMHASKTSLSEACAYEIHDYELLVSAFLCCFCIGPHFGFRIGASKITALLAVKSVDAGSTQDIPLTTWDARKEPLGTPE
jgi:hypothetical protein